MAAWSVISQLISTAQNKGWALLSSMLGKLTRSIVTWPITPFSYRASPTEFEIFVKSICGRLV